MGNILPKKPLWAGGEGKPFVDWLAMELVPERWVKNSTGEG